MYFFLMKRQLPRSTSFPYTTLFRSNEENRSENRKTPGSKDVACQEACVQSFRCRHFEFKSQRLNSREKRRQLVLPSDRSEEHTSELQSHSDLVCRLLLENKKDSRRP